MSGVCRICGCTDLSPCVLQEILYNRDVMPLVGTCSWLDPGHTICTNPGCVAVIPLDELMEICFPPPLAARAGK
jgi:hypothetical protein